LSWIPIGIIFLIRANSQRSLNKLRNLSLFWNLAAFSDEFTLHYYGPFTFKIQYPLYNVVCCHFNYSICFNITVNRAILYTIGFSVSNLVLQRQKNVIAFFGLNLLSGFEIYLGRHCRLNSWDIFQKPNYLFNKIMRQFSNPLTLKVTLTYGFTMFVLFLIFAYMAKENDQGINSPRN